MNFLSNIGSGAIIVVLAAAEWFGWNTLNGVDLEQASMAQFFLLLAVNALVIGGALAVYRFRKQKAKEAEWARRRAEKEAKQKSADPSPIEK